MRDFDCNNKDDQDQHLLHVFQMIKNFVRYEILTIIISWSNPIIQDRNYRLQELF